MKKVLNVMSMVMLLCFVIFVGCKQSPENVQYTVTFDTDGGTTVNPVKADEGKTIKPPETYKTLSKFLGWFTEKNGTGNIFTAETAVISDITVYAKWGPDALPPLSAPSDSEAANPSAEKTSDIGFWMPRHTAILKTLENTKDFDIVFIGDSLIQYWSSDKTWKELENTHKIINLGFGGDQTMHVIWRLENGEFPASMTARFAVVLVGTNNSIMSGHPAESIATGIAKIISIINEKSPATKILLVSLLPRGPTWGGGSASNDAVNAIIKDFDGHLNVSYLDMASLFKNADGSQNTKLFADDKLHLGSSGYNLLNNHLQQILSDK